MNQTENKSTGKNNQYDECRNNNQTIPDALRYEKGLVGFGVYVKLFWCVLIGLCLSFSTLKPRGCLGIQGHLTVGT